MLISRIFTETDDSRAYFGAFTDRGQLSGTASREGTRLSFSARDCTMTCNWERDQNGIFHRRDRFQNSSAEPVTVYSLKSRFVFEGGEYEVYTQFNNWLLENQGGWQELVTGVTCGCASVRTAQDATPILVLWNKQQNRGVVFHLLPNCAWEIKATRIGCGGKNSRILVELGIRDQNLALQIAPGEEIPMPEILCWETSNRMDFDSHKLHSWLHTRYPRRRLPFVFNSWLYNFTRFSLETLCRQADLAAEMGLEYFVVDAGWFKPGAAWYDTVGDWQETTEGGLLGHMKELSDYVRSKGMKFGLWMEPERAGKDSQIIQTHPEQFFPYRDNRFLDFSNPEAVDRIFAKTCELVERYGIEYFKFDFNADLFYDPSHGGFLRWHLGHTDYLRRLREKYPDIYLSCCAGGGERTDLANYQLYDSFWATDDVGPFAQLNILKQAIFCIPPQAFERWTAIHSMDKYADHYAVFNGEFGSGERILAGQGGAWCDLISVRQSVLQAFHTAGPVGFSCNLEDISPTLRSWLKEQLAAIRADNAFWLQAVVRKLTDTPTMTAYQYSDESLSRVILQAISGLSVQQTIRLYPVLKPDAVYSVDGGAPISGAELMAGGICLKTNTWHSMSQAELKEL